MRDIVDKTPNEYGMLKNLRPTYKNMVNNYINFTKNCNIMQFNIQNKIEKGNK
jgi:hypothetical protein